MLRRVIVVIAGSNRPGSRTLQVAREAVRHLGAEAPDLPVHLVNLEAMPHDLFVPASYKSPPAAFLPHQAAILAAQGVLTIVPEYNGSYPGALKYFIDLLKFPESLRGVPCGFVGLAAGEWGGLRAVEQLEMVFKYRSALLYGQSLYVREVHRNLSPEGRLSAPLDERLCTLVRGFVAYTRQVKPGQVAGRAAT